MHSGKLYLTEQVGDEESRLIADWVLVTTFKILSAEHILQLFAAFLLEKPLIVLSKNLCTVSSVVYAPNFPK